MKKLFLLLIVITVVSVTLTAQRKHDRQHKVPDKIMQLEKIKLIETLEMDEETRGGRPGIGHLKSEHRMDRNRLHTESRVTWSTRHSVPRE